MVISNLLPFGYSRLSDKSPKPPFFVVKTFVARGTLSSYAIDIPVLSTDGFYQRSIYRRAKFLAPRSVRNIHQHRLNRDSVIANVLSSSKMIWFIVILLDPHIDFFHFITLDNFTPAFTFFIISDRSSFVRYRSLDHLATPPLEKRLSTQTVNFPQC
jgi:hypothetical protein